MLMITVLAGCSKQQTLVDQFYGTSYELAKQSQLHNPHAGIGDGSSSGLEGSIAQKVVDRYEKGFDQEAVKTDRYSVIFDGMKQK